jgi:hypothetical protein
MEQVTLDAEAASKIGNAKGQVVLADQAGKVLGVVVRPDEYDRMTLALMSREPTAEELEASRASYREKGGWTTAQVLAHLAEIERKSC